VRLSLSFCVGVSVGVSADGWERKMESWASIQATDKDLTRKTKLGGLTQEWKKLLAANDQFTSKTFSWRDVE
jgi:hypothetical protein